MKISLQLEADSAEELREFFATFQAAPALIAKGWTAAQEPKPAPQPIPVPPAPVPAPPPPPVPAEPPVPEEQPPAAAEAPVKAKRGRPRKAPEETVMVPAPVPVNAAPVQPASALTGNGTGAVSRQDLLDVFAEYVQRYGANFGYTDISGLLQKHLGEGVRKASDVPENLLSQAISAIKTAIVDNPFNRKRDYA